MEEIDRKPIEVSSTEDDDDCIILDYDPFHPSDFKSLQIDDNGDEDLKIVALKGQVACRDYPHSRHLCGEFPFEKTPHEKHCKLCYCYMCDAVAPCKLWFEDDVDDHEQAHCHASEHVGDWKFRRSLNAYVKNLAW